MLEEIDDNNYIVFTILSQMQTPATLDEIVFFAAQLLGYTPEEITETVLRALENGVKCGCIQKVCNSYLVVPCDS